MRVTLLNGSAARVSHTADLLKVLENTFLERGVDVEVVSLVNLNLPIVMTEFHNNPMDTPNKAVKSFVRLIEASDALVIASPLYHGSFSGLLKNALDSLKGDALRGKVVGLVSNAGGMKNTQALEHLRSVVRTMYGYATQTQIGTSNSDFEMEGGEFVLEDVDIKRRCERLVDEMLFLIFSFRNLKY